MKCAQVPSENVPTWSTWLNNNSFISNYKIQQQQQQQQPSYPRATPLPPVKELLSERASSPTSWGEFKSKESPVLPIPSYPALCREDTTSWIDGRPSTPNMTASCRGPPWSDHKLLDFIACKRHSFGRAGGNGRGGREAASCIKRDQVSQEFTHVEKTDWAL